MSGFRNRTIVANFQQQYGIYHRSDMYRRLLDYLKPALRIDRRLTHEELLQLAEAIIDYGQRLRAYEEWSVPPPLYTIVEIPELVRRFEETPKTINAALLLLNGMGGAEPVSSRIWKLKLSLGRSPGGFSFLPQRLEGASYLPPKT